MAMRWIACIFLLLGLLASVPECRAAEGGGAPPAPLKQTEAEAATKSAGCRSCHTTTDSLTMHTSPGVTLGCTDCHGGNAAVFRAAVALPGSSEYRRALDAAHIQPRYPEEWNYPSSVKPPRTYTLLNRESPEFIRFLNPSDYRVAREACGACHLRIIAAAERSAMANTAMFWAAASYNNGILPLKHAFIGEASAASPGVISLFFRNDYYANQEAYLFAIAEAMRGEYEAIAAAGVMVQIDCPDLAMGRHIQYADLSVEEFRKRARLHIEALNHALAAIPPERVRMHLCWGEGPHHRDVPLAEIIDVVF